MEKSSSRQQNTVALKDGEAPKFTSGPQIGKHHGKKQLPGSKTPWLWRTEKPQNCTPKMPNVTSETHRKWCFWLLFPLAAAMNFSYLYIRSPNRKNSKFFFNSNQNIFNLLSRLTHSFTNISKSLKTFYFYIFNQKYFQHIYNHLKSILLSHTF